MSTATSRLRRVGVGGLATAVVLGTALTGAGTANAWVDDDADTPTVTEGSEVTVTAGDMTLVSPGRPNQPVAPVTIGVDGWQEGDTLTLTLANPVATCATAETALGFSNPTPPTIRAAKAPTANAAETTVPTFDEEFGPGTCTVPGVTTEVVITFTNHDMHNDTGNDVAGSAADGPGSILNVSNILAYVGADLRGPITLEVSAADAGTDVTPPVTVADVVAHTAPATTTPTTGKPDTTISAPSVTVTEQAAAVIADTITFRLNYGAWVTAGTLTTPAGVTVTDSAISTTDPRLLTFTLNNTTTTPGTFTLSGASIHLPNYHAAITVNADELGAVPYASSIAQGRIYGEDRYETAAAAFRAAGGVQRGVAVLATGVDFADALAANALAGEFTTGTLLTRTNSLPPATREALIDAVSYYLGAAGSALTVYVVGGEDAISPAVVDEIRNLGLNPNIGGDALNPVRVIRVSGSDRTKTAEAISTHVSPVGAVTVNTTTGPTAVVASGWNYPDALAIGPASYAYDMPLFLTQRDGTLSDSTLQALDASGASNVIIVGGVNAVPAAVETQLDAQYNVLRLSGADRYATAAAIASWELKTPVPTDSADTGGLNWGQSTECGGGTDDGGTNDGGTYYCPTNAYLATGNNFPDALAGGPVAGSWLSPILLVPLSADETGLLSGYTADLFSSVTPFGGTAVVSNDVRTTAAVATAGVPNQLVYP